MCLVLDTNCFHKVFAGNKISPFKEVHTWLFSGRGKLVMGGTTYLRETTIKMQKYNKLISELRKKGKVVTCSQDEVDAWEKTLLKRGVPKIDDPHLVALISVSGCKLICSADSKADYIITDKLNYKPPTKPPKIIRSKSSKKLLHAKNVAGCCC